MEKKIFFATAIATVFSGAVMAQTGQWKLSGNSLDGTQALGSTNNFSLDFITNNVKRMSLTNKGNLKINSDQSSIQFPNAGANPKPIMFLYESGINTSRMVLAHSPAFPDYGLRYNSSDQLEFTGSGQTVLNVGLGSKLVGVGTSQPLSKLHILNGVSGASPIANTVFTVENSTSNYISLLAPSNAESGVLFGKPFDAASGGIIYNNPSSLNGLQFRTNGNATRMVLTKDGNVGVGTINPKTNLHIFRGSAGGISPNIESPLTLEANGNSFINILTPVANVSGILLGNNNNAADGGIVYGGASHRMELRTNGNITRMAITEFGGVAIGTLDPGNFQLKIVHNADFGGLGLENGFSHSNWGLFANEFGDLDLFHNGNFMGEFNKNTGAYTGLSVEPLVTTIQPMQPVLEKIKQLKPSSYQLKNSTVKQDYNGFITEDVKKVFPNLLSHTVNKKSNLDAYTIDYSGLSVIAIKGIQELAKMNEEKDAKIDALQKQNNDLEKRIEKLEGMMGASSVNLSQPLKNISSTPSLLEQNIPNPFSNSTTIHYTLPQSRTGETTAQILIADMNGKTIKQVNVPGNGKGLVNIDASALSSGTYSYSLIVDGKLIDTKRMILTK